MRSYHHPQGNLFNYEFSIQCGSTSAIINVPNHSPVSELLRSLWALADFTFPAPDFLICCSRMGWGSNCPESSCVFRPASSFGCMMCMNVEGNVRALHTVFHIWSVHFGMLTGHFHQGASSLYPWWWQSMPMIRFLLNPTVILSLDLIKLKRNNASAV